MVKKSSVIAIVLAVGISMCGCSKKTVPSTVAYGSYETECLGVNPGGSMRLRVWGEGKDASAAAENARKKAVEAVLFTHITAGPSSATAKWPVISSPTRRKEKHEYFSKFFDGQYKKYIKAEKADAKARYFGNDRCVQALEVTVDREGLIKKMTKDNIL